MKDLGLPLGFMNTSAMLVNEDGTVKLHKNDLSVNKHTNPSLPNDSINNPKKRHNKKRGKRKVRLYIYTTSAHKINSMGVGYNYYGIKV